MPMRETKVMRRIRLMLAVSTSFLAMCATPALAQNMFVRERSGASKAASAAAMQGRRAAMAAQRQALSFTRSAKIKQDFAARQAAARSAAALRPRAVPNGLRPGGLDPAPGVGAAPGLWQRAERPTQVQDGVSTRVRIRQTEDKAILTWRTFNVGRETELTFDQSAGGADAVEWSVLNRVQDPNARPSEILGTINAQGQVYIVNRNGIVFDGTSRINAAAIIASSLNVTTNQFQRGILDQADPTQPQPAFAALPGPPAGSVEVRAGAELTATQRGRVILLGPKVTNDGTITTPSGQTILAAGEKVYLSPLIEGPVETGGNYAPQPGPRVGGILVAEVNEAKEDGEDESVVSVSDRPGKVVNNGLISAPRGNISISSYGIEQNGVLAATTSVVEPGTIRLDGRDGVVVSEFTLPGIAHTVARSGTVTLGPGSLTEILPEADGQTINDSQEFRPSEVEVTARDVILGRDATVRAPGGLVAINAFDAYFLGDPGEGPPSRIYLEKGSLIDVAGLTSAIVPMERNVIDVKLNGYQLRDSPVQRDGPLFKETVRVDVRTGTPLADVSGDIALLGRSVEERSAPGGTVTLAAGSGSSLQPGEVIVRRGASIDVSGGFVTYTGGLIDTTQLRTADGRLVDIGQARPDIAYAGIADEFTVTHERWGVNETWRSPLLARARYEPGYIDGADAGRALLFGSSIALDGDISGAVYPGTRQRTLDERPLPGGLLIGSGRGAVELGDYSFDLTEDRFGLFGNGLPLTPGLAGDVVVRNAPAALPGIFDASAGLPATRRDTLTLDAGLIGEDGIGFLSINAPAEGDVVVEGDVTLRTPAGGMVALRSDIRLGASDEYGELDPVRTPLGSILLEGSVIAPGGRITLSGGAVTLSPTTLLSAAGTWANDRLVQASADPSPPVVLDGGDVTVYALKGFSAPAGSVIDVSGGGRVTSVGELEGGSGGSIEIRPNRVLDFAGYVRPEGTPIELAGELRGYGVQDGAGGSLTLGAGAVWIGRREEDETAPYELRLDPSFFRTGGFATYELHGYGGLTVAEGTVLTPAASSLLLTPEAPLVPGGEAIRDITRMVLRPRELRVPTSVTFYARSALQPAAQPDEVVDLRFGRNAVLRADPGAQIRLFASRSLLFDGAIEAPGGDVTLFHISDRELPSDDLPVNWDLSDPSPSPPYDPEVVVRLGKGSQVLARGEVLAVTDPATGLRDGRALPGGVVRLGHEIFGIAAPVVVSPGAVIDVSGGSGVLDLPVNLASVPSVGTPVFRPTSLSTDAGGIVITAAAGIFLDGTLLGRPGGEGAAGGTLALRTSNEGLDFVESVPSDVAAILSISQRGRSPLAGAPLGPDILEANFGQGNLAADQVAAGGFDGLWLASSQAIRFEGDVELALGRSLFLETIMLGATPGSTVELGAPHVLLTNDYAGNVGEQLEPTPFEGQPSELTVRTDLLDIRNGFDLGGELRGYSYDAQQEVSLVKLDGFAQTRLISAGDVRFIGETGDVFLRERSVTVTRTPTLRTQGDLTIEAAQIYPATDQSFIVAAPAGRVTILPNGPAPAVPLSAGGSLTFEAREVVQRGVVRAPLGEIVFRGEERVLLAPGSQTSTSADGLVIPYGGTSNANIWIGPGGERIEAPPAKRVRLEGQAVDVAEGAIVDVSGGGDLYGAEFTPGLGGSSNVLEGRSVYAVIPGYAGPAPYDPSFADRGYITEEGSVAFQDPLLDPQRAGLPFGSGTDLRVGDQVTLSGGAGLPAGTYTLLPGRYALLPGAYRIEATPDTLDLTPSLNAAALDGSAVVSGFRGVAGTDIRDARTSGFEVAPGATTVRARSAFIETSANEFFASERFLIQQERDLKPTVVPPRPLDGGTLVADAVERLRLDGVALFAAEPGGRLGRFDITAERIAVTGSAGGAGLAQQGYLVLDPQTLGAFGAGSLLLGGTRTETVEGTAVADLAEEVRVSNDAANPLVAPEILLAAEEVAIEEGAVVETATLEDAASGGETFLLGREAILDEYGYEIEPAVSGDGAFLRLSAGGERAVVERILSSGRSGTLTVAPGARLVAAGTLTLDASRDATVAPGAVLEARLIEAGSSRISFGAAPAGTGGLVLDAGGLDAFSRTEELILRSASTLDFYGNVTLGGDIQALTLDGAGLVGRGGDVAIGADRVTLVNTRGAVAGDGLPAAGEGSLVVTAAGRLELPGGDVRVAGFGSATLAAGERLVTRELGSLTADGDLRLAAGEIVAAAGSDQRLTAAGALTTVAARDASVLPTLAPELGGRLTLEGQSIRHDGRLVARAGLVRLAAAQGDVVLAETSTIDASGYGKAFFDVVRALPGGTVELRAEQGNIDLRSGAVVDLSGAAIPGAGDAGRLMVEAPRGQFVLAGEVRAQGAEGTRQGALELDVGTLTNDFGAFASALDVAGFREEQRLRIRSGDVTIPGDAVVRARRYALAADAGRIEVAGTIDASGPTGGRISLAAGRGITLRPGAELDASGATVSSAGRGGRVELMTTDGALDLSAGSAIDVAGGGGALGRVLLRAPRVGNDVRVASLGGEITGAERVTVEAVRIYESRTVDDALRAVVADDIAALDGRAIATRLGVAGDARIAVRPGVEVRSPGDLTVADAWDLFPLRTAGGEPGALTLRASGDLFVNKSLSDGFTTTGEGATVQSLLQAGPSWSLRLVGGADLTGADPLALRLDAVDAAPGSPASGDVVLAAETRVRTGTGDIAVAAGGDVVLQANSSVIYTAGELAPTTGDFDAPEGAVYPVGGGDVAIRARGNLEGVPSGQLITSWLYRQGYYPDPRIPSDRSFAQTSWWLVFDDYRQGVGALGGGDVELLAGGDIRSFDAMLPTTGWVTGGRSFGAPKQLHVRGGGDLTVRAGRDLLSGVYYVGKGVGAIEAGRDVGSAYTLTYELAFERTDSVQTIFALGDGALRVRAADDLAVETVLDPMLVRQDNEQGEVSFYESYDYYCGCYTSERVVSLDQTGFVTRTEDSSVDLVASGGDLLLSNDSRIVRETISPDEVQFESEGIQQGRDFASEFATVVYPATVRAVAASGELTVGLGMQLLPSPRGTLELLAEGDMRLNLSRATLEGPTDFRFESLVMSDVEPRFVATPLNPVTFEVENSEIIRNLARLFSSSLAPPGVLAGIHRGDAEPARLYSVAGDVRSDIRTDGEDVYSAFYDFISLPKSTRVKAGRDIRNLVFTGTNTNAGDLTSFEAARDVVWSEVTEDSYDYYYEGDGANLEPLTGPLGSGGIQVGGPGRVVVSAGRDVVLSSSYGVVTDGNLRSPLLPDRGADLTVTAGVGGNRPRDDAGFLARYLDPANVAALPDYLQAGPGRSIYSDRLVTFMEGRERLGNEGAAPARLSVDEAWTQFLALPAEEQAILINDVFFAELLASGREANDVTNPRFGATDRGYDAIAALFPGDAWAGNVEMLDSQLKTERGGSLDILVPGGRLQLGVNVAEGANASRLPLDSGLWTLNGGDIRTFTNGDVVVRSSRAFTIEGGDILMWSSFGNIDAGAGPRTAISIPPPFVQVLPDGTTRVEYKGVTTGSGIGTLSNPGTPPGDVDLFAPNGIVDAGDAGIRVSGDLTIFALEVRNADNIQVSGVSLGVPQAVSANIGALTAASNASSAVTQAAENAVQRATPAAARDIPSIITGKVIGFGEG